MDISQISLTTPTSHARPSFAEKLKSIRDKFSTLFQALNFRRERSVDSHSFTSTGDRKPKLKLGFIKKLVKPILLAVVAGLILVGVLRSITKPQTTTGSDIEVSVKGASATQDINREFTIPLEDAQGEEVSRIKFMVEKAELRDEIIVKGAKATATEGRVFLIITFKITNEFGQGVEVKTRDYFRLAVNGNESEWLAPDIHNDPVEVQAISTKPTRLGFPINKSDTNLILRTGSIDGEKQTFNLELK